MKYRIEIVSTKTVSVDADSRIEAIKLAKEKHTDYNAKHISDFRG